MDDSVPSPSTLEWPKLTLVPIQSFFPYSPVLGDWDDHVKKKEQEAKKKEGFVTAKG